jgi:hypothetical protein
MLCLGIATLFATVGTLAEFSSMGTTGKAITEMISGSAAIIYAFIAWRCRK